MNAEVGTPLFVAHQKIYPREIEGRFNRLRVIATSVLFGLFYLLPWVKWDGHQAILFDLPARRFYLFGLTLFPQDFYFLSWLLLIAALTLFFFTALAGRLWCGFACPQTLWTQVFVWMERLAEGNRAQQIRLDKAPWTADKLLRKSFKQLMWISFAALTGFTFVGFFTAVDTLRQELASVSLGNWELFWMIFYGFATYGNAGYLREQVCKYMCPYARFQSAMFDRNTLVISYDTARGEPRGPRARGADFKQKGLGACVDCTLCVQVCPTGIDIRKGLQYECIGCTACIDACDSVMDKLEYPRGLIRYTTQTTLEGKKAHILRPRIVIYGVILASLMIGFAVALMHRTLADLDVIRDRNSLYRTLSDGRIENVYTVRLVNKDTKPHTFALSVEQLPTATLDMDSPTLEVGAGEVRSTVIRVRVDSSTKGGRTFTLRAQATDASIADSSEARFLASAP